ncbi:hypothetical protein [Bacillus pseudomycoides]|uniref:hypothetical protein n=2 Tax=Bacillus pseudomycoides TaxID=64104 RepID=UPI001155BE97|nr:hypothetical protein [Bacillus pseudomycoides]
MQHVGNAMAVVMQRAEIMRKKMRAESGTCQALLSEYKCSKCMDSEVVFYEEVNEFGMSKKIRTSSRTCRPH